MIPPFSLDFSLRYLTFVSALGAWALWFFFRGLWRRDATKGAYGALVGGLFVAHAAWATGPHHPTVSAVGARCTSVGLVLFSAFVVSLPLAGLAHRVLDWFFLPEDHEAPGARVTLTPRAPYVSRRAFVSGATALVPAIAVGSGVHGFFTARSGTDVKTLPLVFPHLPPELEGLTILHLSDLHLGVSKHVADLERLLEGLDDARPRRPDLIVFTGDLAEDLRQLRPALELAHAFRPRLGVFASLGNHEYLRGIHAVRPIFDRSPVPLLVNRGTELTVGNAKLFVGGVDDPVVVQTDIRPWLRPNVEAAMRQASSSAFRLLLSHRPEGFDEAERIGVDLTLAGHTHGGQIGFNGKSAFEPLFPDGYLWGPYARGRSRLYTTSGFGHWFPFRIGCPTEAPLLVLRRAEETDARRGRKASNS